MRARDKIFILLLAITLLLGAVIFFGWSDNEDAVSEFRRILSDDPRYSLLSSRGVLADLSLKFGDMSAWGYGGIAVFAIVMIGLILRTVLDGELQALKRQLNELQAAKEEAEGSLQDKVMKEKHARQAKEAALQDLESSLNRIYELENQLIEKEKFLKSHDAELKASQTRSMGLSVGPADRLLAEELRKKTELLRAKESAAREIEKGLKGQIHDLQRQLSEQEQLLKHGENELETLRRRGSEKKDADRDADRLLEGALKKQQDALREKEAAAKELEKNLSTRIRALESELAKKNGLLQNRNRDLEELRSEVKGLTAQLNDIASHKKEAESLLQEQLRKEKKSLQDQDAAIRELEKKYSGQVRDREIVLSEKDALLERRGMESEELKAEVNLLAAKLKDVESTRKETERLFQEELKKERKGSQDHDAAIRELEKKLVGQIRSLESALNDKDRLLESRNIELMEVKSEVAALSAQLSDVGATKKETESSLLNQLRNEKKAVEERDAAIKDLERQLRGKVQAIAGELAKKDELLERRSKDVEELKSEVNVLAAQLNDVGTNKREAESLLQEQLRKEKKALQEQEAALKELETFSHARLNGLEDQLRQKDELLKDRDAELENIKNEVRKIESAKQEGESLLQAKLRREQAEGETKESAIARLEQGFRERVQDLASELSEKEALLDRREAEIEGLRSEMGALTERLNEMALAAERRQNSLPAEIGKSKFALQGNNGEAIEKELEESLKRVQELEELLSDKEKLLKAREGNIDKLASDLKEKKAMLARHEVAEWQSVERRAQWKRRLAKLGISMKD